MVQKNKKNLLLFFFSFFSFSVSTWGSLLPQTKILLHDDVEISVEELGPFEDRVIKIVTPYSERYSIRVKEIQEKDYVGPLYSIEVESEFSITTTPEHIFLSESYSAISMRDLEVGDKISTQHGIKRVNKKEMILYDGKIYTLVLGEGQESTNLLNMSFLTNGIVSCDGL